MKSQWSDVKAAEFVARYGPKWGEDLALRTYTSRLLGSEPTLVLHGGGNTSVKATRRNVLGESIEALFVKASGQNLATIEPEGHSCVRLEYLKKLRGLASLDDAVMVNELRTHLLDSKSPTPSIETLTHAFIPRKFIDHTHADAVLALTNRADGRQRVREALGEDVVILDYVRPGFQLAKAVADAYDAQPTARGMVWLLHGLTTWGATARESYEMMIELVTRAETYLAKHATRSPVVRVETPVATAEERAGRVMPLVRGLLARHTGDGDHPWRRMILRPLVNRQVLDFVDWDRGRELALSPPLTADHLVRTKPWPVWIVDPAYDDLAKLREQLTKAIQKFAADYDAYFARHATHFPAGITRFDSLPRVVLLPGLGALCAGKNVVAADIARDITAQTLAVKAQVAGMGGYVGLSEEHLFDMEYFTLQHAKLKRHDLPLGDRVALITGAAGAIGSAIADALLEQGCHVAITDLPGENLDKLVGELKTNAGERVAGFPMDVTVPQSVAAACESVARTWGGVDLVIVNAGLAHVASLAEMDLDAFRRLERVNTEGTMLVMGEAARHFKLQGTGGDIVLISTKNVFAPGAKFGAYSATKAAAHQLARVASLELAEMDVRVNMVAPDAIFSHGARKSGLWAEVGPDRMRARGLDEAGLEEYYRNRNLLKAKVTARHVANAVLFFATRQTPTTGATLPVDGGLPDATPR